MIEKRDNYQIQVQQAKLRFLTYDQPELIERCRLHSDEKYLYTRFLNKDYRICRVTGDMEYLQDSAWKDGNSFAEVLTILDWLCDSREDRYVTGRWINIVSHGHYFHRDLQEEKVDPEAEHFSRHPELFAAACEALGGEKMPGADMSYAIELLDGLRILVQLWHGDEEFPAKLSFLWDENTTRYIRYETTWYALGFLQKKLCSFIKG
ncbi:MAG: DUF3786 domain-containing protein [Ruminococcaceae bacterium]|nr:DUF3786 domain-containing protein [Oscillospiraceae bacterium]